MKDVGSHLNSLGLIGYWYQALRCSHMTISRREAWNRSRYPKSRMNFANVTFSEMLSQCLITDHQEELVALRCAGSMKSQLASRVVSL